MPSPDIPPSTTPASSSSPPLPSSPRSVSSLYLYLPSAELGSTRWSRCDSSEARCIRPPRPKIQAGTIRLGDPWFSSVPFPRADRPKPFWPHFALALAAGPSNRRRFHVIILFYGQKTG